MFYIQIIHIFHLIIISRVPIKSHRNYTLAFNNFFSDGHLLIHFLWLQDLYLDSVKIFKDSKLEEITDLMLEKEIRLQIPLEEMDILQQ